MVNTPLLNPVQTKREYFWLFMIVVLENLIALGIELINGGVWTSQVSSLFVLHENYILFTIAQMLGGALFIYGLIYFFITISFNNHWYHFIIVCMIFNNFAMLNYSFFFALFIFNGR